MRLRGCIMMSSAIRPQLWGPARPARAFGPIQAAALFLSASLLVALEVPSKPFLDKNSFYLSSAGFRVQLANDAAAKKAMHALPPHRFVVPRYGNDVPYLYAEPNPCVCVFIGPQAAYDSYRIILRQPPDNPDYVAADFKTQVSALLAAAAGGVDKIRANTLAP